MQMQTKMAFVTTAVRITGAAEIMLMQTVMGTATIMRTVMTEDADGTAALTADMDIVLMADADTADDKKKLLCGASRKQSEPSNSILILCGGSV